MTDDKEPIHLGTASMFLADDDTVIQSSETPYCGRHSTDGVLQTGDKSKVTCDYCLRKLYPTPAWRN